MPSTVHMISLLIGRLLPAPARRRQTGETEAEKGEGAGFGGGAIGADHPVTNNIQPCDFRRIAIGQIEDGTVQWKVKRVEGGYLTDTITSP
jgi:hypothetical protein